MTDHIIRSPRELAAGLGELYDYEIKHVAQIVSLLTLKYSHRPNTRKNLDELRDEATSRLADIGIHAKVDPTPALRGEPPIIDILGRLEVQALDHHGLKEFEVKEAVKRGEAFRGQKETANMKSKAAKTKKEAS